jgi:hypothetical protein
MTDLSKYIVVDVGGSWLLYHDTSQGVCPVHVEEVSLSVQQIVDKCEQHEREHHPVHQEEQPETGVWLDPPRGRTSASSGTRRKRSRCSTGSGCTDGSREQGG